MRQIKFRGIDTMSGEMVYGNLVQQELADGNITTAIVQTYATYDVKPETVGQYTGLHDCNGKEIYEGDILRYTRHNVRGEGIHNETWVHECIVYWDEEKHAFWHSMKLSCGSCSGLLIFKDERAEKEEIEVIGNIHDK